MTEPEDATKPVGNPYSLFQQVHGAPDDDGLPVSPSWIETNSPTGKMPDALLQGDGQFGGGILRDYQQRLPHLASDFWDGLSWKTKSASLFMFCATVTSTVALGDVANRETEGRVGITEYLMLQGVAGVLHALFSGCPLPILRPTGPITAFMTDLWDVAQRMELEYYSLLSWVGFWVGLMLMAIAVLGWSKYIVLCTRFLHDIYAVFVCTIYISDGIVGVVERFEQVEWDQAFFAFYLALFCVIFSIGFYYVDRSTILNRRWRRTIADYAVPLAVVLCVSISYWVQDHVEVDRISMPRNFEPTYNDEYTGEPRSWFQGLSDSEDETSTWSVAGIALVAAIPIVALFYIDHLFSCILGQKQELGLKKGEYYHSSLLITGMCNLILPMFGMPFVTASLPHSPQFTKALTDYADPNRTTPTYVHESRIAPMVVYLLCFGGLIVPSVLELCPQGVVNGILTFVGLQGILPGTGNQFMDRVVLLMTHPSEYVVGPTTPSYMTLPWQRIHLYTAIQLCCLAACWGWRFTGTFALAFPLVFVSFVPFRLFMLPTIFTKKELEALDAEATRSVADDTKNDGGTQTAVMVEASSRGVQTEQEPDLSTKIWHLIDPTAGP